MRLRCRRYRHWISDYCLGDLDKPQQEELERHIRECSFCAKDVEFTKQMVGVLAQRRKQLQIEITDEMSDRLRRKVFARIEEEKRKEGEQSPLRERKRKRILRFAMGSAAAAVIALVFILQALLTQKSPGVDVRTELAQLEIKEAHDQPSGKAKAPESEAAPPEKTPSMQDPETSDLDHARDPVQDYHKAEALFKQIASLEWHYENLVRYDEVITLAEGVKKNKIATPDLVIKAQYLIFGCYHNQAKYPEKYKAFEHYADLVAKYHGQEKAAQLIMQEAGANFAAREYDGAISYYKMIRDKFPKTELSEYASYRIGETYLAIDDYETALKEFSDLLRISPRGTWAEETYLRMAFAYSNQGKTDEAVHLLGELIRTFPKGKRLAYAQYHMGLYRYVKNEYSQSLVEFQKVLRNYPQSSYAPLAKGYIDAINEKM